MQDRLSAEEAMDAPDSLSDSELSKFAPQQCNGNSYAHFRDIHFMKKGSSSSFSFNMLTASLFLCERCVNCGGIFRLTRFPTTARSNLRRFPFSSATPGNPARRAFSETFGYNRII